MLFLIAGCASTRRDAWTGPTSAAHVDVERWTSRDAPAAILQSPHYAIYTTLPPGPRRGALPQVLEGAYAQYQALAPATIRDDRPMHCFIFDRREEWAQFTAQRTGEGAALYLQIPRGGYTVDDWFVAYSDSDAALFSAAAHEGWHQYAARHFKGKLPPFLEEGVACLFETVHMEKGLPRWHGSINPGRARALTWARQQNQLWPLEELISMHAGDVVDLPQPQIDAFYAQSWAFARFLLESDAGRRGQAFRTWLADTAAGKGEAARKTWDPHATRAVIGHYLGADFATVERAYQSFVAQITNEGRAGME